jgi:hypothetical protein
MSMQQWWGGTDGKTEVLFREKPLPSIATLPTKNPTRAGLGSNSGLEIIAYNTSFISLYAFREQFCRNHDFPMLQAGNSTYYCSRFLFSPTHCCRMDFSRTNGRPQGDGTDLTQSGPPLTGSSRSWGIREIVIFKNMQCDNTHSYRTDFVKRLQNK